MVASGIVNMWADDAGPIAEAYHRIEAKHPGRFLLGVGIGHPEASKEYKDPYTTMVEYLDALDAADVPRDRVTLAALGPKVLQLAADRTLGAHPYLTTPEHTKSARSILGSALLAPEHKVVLNPDPEAAQAADVPPCSTTYSSRTTGSTCSGTASRSTISPTGARTAWSTRWCCTATPRRSPPACGRTTTPGLITCASRCWMRPLPIATARWRNS